MLGQKNRCETRKWEMMAFGITKYLEEFVPDSEVHETFPTETEFGKIAQLEDGRVNKLYIQPLQVDNEICDTSYAIRDCEKTTISNCYQQRSAKKCYIKNSLDITLGLCKKYGLKALPRVWSHSIQEIVANENVEIRVGTRVRTAIIIRADQPDILVYDKKRHEVLPIEAGITGQDRLIVIETEKKRKYEFTG
ncbi:unnamed protein product [Thelazia callipaeda]|uniref:NADH dehydrogenase [ubiquinone] 1 alpha subcomplex subunit 8 n=1 Tax=Thelazia callipaeda TaxID=103827 RepID=A0A0N5CJ31_THECL|nr:unnamed protein product [Thelazia callipaeda]